MSTTATDQGVKCGNHPRTERVYHANATEVKACYQGLRTAQVDRELTTVTAPPAPSSQGPRNLDEARNAGIKRLAEQRSPFFQDRNMGRPSEATEGRVRLITSLVEEHLTREGDKAMAEAIVAQLAKGMSNDEAKMVITALLNLKKARLAEPQSAKAATKAPAKSALIDAIMGTRTERNFCIIDEAGKARFYRVSKRGKRSSRPGTWKIQERVSDDLFPRYDSMLVTVAQAIIDQGGAEVAGRRFAELMHRCYECGASLTDTTGNPYYAIGLGPECGAK